MPYTVLNPATAAAAPATTAGAPLTSIGETLSSFQAELLEALQNRLDVGATRQKLWINRAYRQMSFLVDLRVLWSSVSLSVVANQPFYLLPASLAWIKQIVVEDPTDFLWDGGREWNMIDVQTYRNLPDSTNLTDVLTRAYLPYGPMIALWPTPWNAFTAAMDFRVRPLDMVNPTDSPILPPEFHEALFLFALARAQRALGMRSEGDRTYNDAVGALRMVTNTDAEERDAMEMSLTPIRNSTQLYRARG